VRAAHALLVQVVEVPAQGRFGDADDLLEVLERDEAALAHQVQHTLTTFLDQHGLDLIELERFLSML
jgi:hypothetical protein